LWGEISEEEVASMKANIKKTLPTQRLAQPEDVAEAYLNTLKDPSLTGSVIKTDGGGMLK
jgi:NAD(P)-dependent dehydrogenase (short-subunit alcohol dehydrogenase family)